MRIKRHKKGNIIELEDGSEWRIWPGDLGATLLRMPSSRLAVSEIEDECCTHVLVYRSYGRPSASSKRQPPLLGTDRSIIDKLMFLCARAWRVSLSRRPLRTRHSPPSAASPRLCRRLAAFLLHRRFLCSCRLRLSTRADLNSSSE